MIDVVGMGDGDVRDLPTSMQQRITDARVLVGAPRLLEHVPEAPHQQRHALPRPLVPGLQALLDDVDVERGGIVVLASGDPLRSGIGTTLVSLLGADAVQVHPWVSSDTLARARMRWSAETSEIITTVGRDLDVVRRHLTPDARLVVLCSGGSDPGRIARLLVEEGCGASPMTAWWHLGGANEGSRRARAEDWTGDATPDLVTVCIEVDARGLIARPALGSTPGRAEAAFDHDGQITKRDVRASALAHLRPTPGGHLWDLGAGSGSIGIEWALAEPRAHATAVEARAERGERIVGNAARLGVGASVSVVVDDVLAALPALPLPDAVFIGGGATAELIAAAWDRLPAGGRIVVHAVTIESEALLVDAFRARGGELVRISVEQAESLGRFLAWKPARPIVQWSATKAHTTVTEGHTS